MRCDDVQKLLMLADDGDLGRVAAWRARRHLATCPDCAAERADFARLDARLRAADPARGLYAPEPVPTTPASGTALSRRRFALGAATGLALAAVGGVVIFGPGQPGSPAVAFAQVEQAMASVRFAEWTETEVWHHDGAGPKRTTTSTSRVRARMDPPAIRYDRTGVTTGEPDAISSGHDQVSLKTPADYRTYRPEWGEVTVQTYDFGTPEARAAGLRGEILSRFRFTPPDPAGVPPTLDWTTRRVTLGDGRRALEFSVRAKSGADAVTETAFTLWADPETKRVLRVEQRQFDRATGRVTHEKTTDNVRYDVRVPDSAFALGAPAGTPVYHENYLWERQSSLKLTAAEKARVYARIDETFAGALAGDWKRASAGWDLGYAASLPGSPVPPDGTETFLRRVVGAGRDFSVMRRLAVSGVNAAPYVRVMGYGDAALPAGAPTLVAVTLTPGLLRRDGQQEIGTETFYLRRVAGGDFRIVGWQRPERQRAIHRREWLARPRGSGD